MKRFGKILTFIVMVALCSVFAFASPAISIGTVVAASVTTAIGAIITVSKIPTKGEVGSPLTIPKGTSQQGDVKVIVKNPRGQEVYNQVTTTDYTFNPDQIGTYTVQYEVTNASSGYFETKSQVYNINVTGVKPALSFLANQKEILPEIIDANDKVVLPLPVVKEQNDTLVEDYIMLIATGDNQEENNATTNPSSYPVVWVKATDPNYNAVNLVRNADDKITFEASQVDDQFVYGTYSLTYSYQASTGLTVTKTVSINVQKNYRENVTSKIDMTFVWADGDTMPTSAILGNKVTLPTPVAQDKNQGNAQLKSFTTVKVDYIPNGNLKDTVSWISCDVDQQDFTFTPLNKTVNGGYYRIEYKIENFFGVDTIESVVYKLDNVKDTEKPSVYLVKDYTDATDVDTTEDLSYMIPSKMIANAHNSLVLPAIYATDNFVTDLEGLTLRRYWINGSTETRIDAKDANDKYITNTAVTLSTSTDDSNKTPDSVKKCLQTPGTYKVRYEAYDGENTQRSVVFEIVVVEKGTFVDSVAPRITMPTITSTTFAGETVTFKSPTVLDYASTSLSEVNIDSKNVKVEVGYYYGNDYANFLASYQAGEDVSSNTSYHVINTVKDDKTSYSFTVPAAVTGNELYIVVRATDNAKYGDLNNVLTADNNISVKTQQIRLVSIASDDEAPEFDQSQIVSSHEEYSQNEKIDIKSTATDGAFVFTSADADFVKVNVNVYDPNGKAVSVRGLSRDINAAKTQITASGAYFTSTIAGDYTVVLTATDYSGNSRIVSYKLTVKDTEAPVIELSSIPASVEVGKEIILPKAVVMDNGEIIENTISNEIKFVGDNPAHDFDIATGKFIAREAGTFTFKYVASDGTLETESAIQTIVATDSQAPVFEEYDWEPTAALTPILSNGVETGNYEVVEIPYINATDLNGIKEYSVTVKNPKGEVIKTFVGSTNLNANNNYEFEPTAKDGKYTVIYKVTDYSGKSTTLEKTLAVGDIIDPEIEIANADINLPTSIKLNGTIKINEADLTLTDNKDGVIDVDDYLGETTTRKLEVSVKQPDGTTQVLTKSGGYWTYTFETAGTYTLTYTLTDEAGNIATRSSTIVVSAEDVKTTNVETIWGTILIVASLSLLAGVVVYFVVTNKKPSNADAKSREDAKERARKLDK